jgi:hypothetical protein
MTDEMMSLRGLLEKSADAEPPSAMIPLSACPRWQPDRP